MLHTRSVRALAALPAVLALAACASAGAPAPAVDPAGDEPALPGTPAGVPGFDTRDYPGDAAMARWRARSPYRWVGYYLPAPCYTGTSWMGKREALQRMGWGMAVLFLGEQDWEAGAAPPVDDPAPRCTRANVTPERGRADGRAAAEAAAAEGFPSGTAIYLDVERVDSVPPALAAYVRAWTEAVREDGRFDPALYAHARNAGDLHGVMADAAGGTPRLWVAGGSGFDLLQPPTASGFDQARVWQGALDVDDTWGGVTLRIDRNVADTRNPSG